MENVEIVDTVEEVLEEHDGNIGDAIIDTTGDAMDLFIEGYNEGYGKGLVQGSSLVAGAWISVSLWKNRKVVLSKAKGMFKKGEEVVAEVEQVTARPVRK